MRLHVLLGEHQWAEMKAISPVAALVYFWTFLGELHSPAPFPFHSIRFLCACCTSSLSSHVRSFVRPSSLKHCFSLSC